jgi:hypothetical protein
MGKVGSTTLMRAVQSAGHVVDRVYAGNEEMMDWRLFDRVITAVRDPVARNISQHFETDGKEPIDNDWPLRWISEYLEPRTGIDVYKGKFPTVKGWKIYQGYLLIVKTELMSEVLGDALTLFCGEANYEIDHRASGRFKFGGEYEAFVENSVFDKELLDQMYGSKYARHFYSPKQIAALRKKWS